MKATATTVHRLVQGSKVFLIPTFQRRYTWRKEQWSQLWADLLHEYEIDYPDDPDTLYGHFLGSVVLHPTVGAASTLMQHQVIDGQQRLTTILILLAAMRDVRKDLEPDWNAAFIEDQYLRNPYSKDHSERLVPTRLDRDAYLQTVRNKTPTGDVGMAYNFFRGAITSAHNDGYVLERLQNTLLLNMLLVEINTKAGDSINSIFNTLNSKGLDLSPADLVRNELLHHVGEARGEMAHQQYWIPMEIALVSRSAKAPDREFVTFLWSREVALNPKVSREGLFAAFERRLRQSLQSREEGGRQIAALEVLREMYEDHLLFRILRDPARGESDGRFEPRLLESLRALRDWRAEPATPIVLWLLKQVAAGKLEQEPAARTLDVLLSYLVKRTLNGIPTNQLNRLLTPIASDLAQRSASSVELPEVLRSLLSKQGYYWPSDAQVLSAVETNPIYASSRRYVKFLLSAVEARLPGTETAALAKTQIDHVVPQSLSADWEAYLDELGVDMAETEALIHTLGNLTLTENNQKMGNAVYAKKRAYYVDSALRLNRGISEYDDFGPDEIRVRSEALTRLLLDVFPYGPLASARVFDEDESGASVGDRLESLLQSLPVGKWVTEEDLVSVLGAPLSGVRGIANLLDPTLARLIRTSQGAVPRWYADQLQLSIVRQDEAQGDRGTRLDAEVLERYARNDDSDTAAEEDEDGEI